MNIIRVKLDEKNNFRIDQGQGFTMVAPPGSKEYRKAHAWIAGGGTLEPADPPLERQMSLETALAIVLSKEAGRPDDPTEEAARKVLKAHADRERNRD